MHIFITVVHILIAVVLILTVLLQAGKGSEMGAAFGGSSQTIFGSRGATTFLAKVTVGAAVLFMVTSLWLSVAAKGKSVMPDADPSSVTATKKSDKSTSKDNTTKIPSPSVTATSTTAPTTEVPASVPFTLPPDPTSATAPTTEAPAAGGAVPAPTP